MPQTWQISHKVKCNWKSAEGVNENLHLVDIPEPNRPIKPRHALVRIHAAALNARDLMVVSRDTETYPIETGLDLVPCLDGAAEVIEAGEGSKWKKGDKVLFRPVEWHVGQEVPDLFTSKGLGAGDVDGTLREVAVVADDGLTTAPKGLSYEELASLPTAAGTAANGLFFGPQPVKAGMSVLVLGTGGVSVAAVQLASAIGATVIATSSSDNKLKQVKAIGATHTINYKTHPEWSQEVLRLTNGVGVDHVIETGGIGTIEQSLRSTKRGGVISLIGLLADGGNLQLAKTIMDEILFNAKTIRGVFDIRDDMMDLALEIVQKRGVKPFFGEVFEWEQAKEAFKRLQSQSFVGKIVVKVGQK